MLSMACCAWGGTREKEMSPTDCKPSESRTQVSPFGGLLCDEGEDARDRSDDRPEDEHRQERAGEATAALEHPLGAGEQRLEGGGEHRGEEQRRAEGPDDVDRERDGHGEERPEGAPGPRRRGPRPQRRAGAFARGWGDTLRHAQILRTENRGHHTQPVPIELAWR